MINSARRFRLAIFSAAVAAVAVAAVAAAPAFAADGRIPIYEPIEILTPGAYVVTRNIHADPQAIKVDGVAATIDLNGFALFAMGPVISVVNGGSLILVNGRLSSIGDCIDTTTTGPPVRVRVSGVEFGPGNTAVKGVGAEEIVVTDSTFHDVGTAVSVLGGARTLVRIANNRIDARTRAIELDSSVGSQRAEILDNVVRTTDDAAIVVRGLYGGVVIRGNVVSTGAGSGLYVAGSGGHRIESNVVRQAAGPGMEVLSGGNLVYRNVVSGGGAMGIRVFGNGNVIESNQVFANWGDGIEFTGMGNVYRENTSRSNGDLPYRVGAGNTDAGGNL